MRQEAKRNVGGMWAYNLHILKLYFLSIKDRLANFACFGKCQSSYERAMQIKERSKDRSALQKSERPGRTDRPAYMNILADFQKQTNTQLQVSLTIYVICSLWPLSRSASGCINIYSPTNIYMTNFQVDSRQKTYIPKRCSC